MSWRLRVYPGKLVLVQHWYQGGWVKACKFDPCKLIGRLDMLGICPLTVPALHLVSKRYLRHVAEFSNVTLKAVRAQILVPNDSGLVALI